MVYIVVVVVVVIVVVIVFSVLAVVVVVWWRSKTSRAPAGAPRASKRGRLPADRKSKSAASRSTKYALHRTRTHACKGHECIRVSACVKLQRADARTSRPLCLDEYYDQAHPVAAITGLLTGGGTGSEGVSCSWNTRSCSYELAGNAKKAAPLVQVLAHKAKPTPRGCSKAFSLSLLYTAVVFAV